MQISQEPIVLFIMTLWIVIWITFFLGGTKKTPFQNTLYYSGIHHSHLY